MSLRAKEGEISLSALTEIAGTWLVLLSDGFEPKHLERPRHGERRKHSDRIAKKEEEETEIRLRVVVYLA